MPLSSVKAKEKIKLQLRDGRRAVAKRTLVSPSRSLEMQQQLLREARYRRQAPGPWNLEARVALGSLGSDSTMPFKTPTQQCLLRLGGEGQPGSEFAFFSGWS